MYTSLNLIHLLKNKLYCNDLCVTIDGVRIGDWIY
jgi:hypothetical protein